MQEAFAEHIDHLGKAYPKDQSPEVIVALDRAPWHRGKLLNEVLQRHEHIALYYLPSYSPQLSPIERLWKPVRRDVTHNQLYDEVSDLSFALDQRLLRFKRRRQTVLQALGPVPANLPASLMRPPLWMRPFPRRAYPTALVSSSAQQGLSARWWDDMLRLFQNTTRGALLMELLKPTSKPRVMDLVAEAGIDVAPWSVDKKGNPITQPAANPAYCYEWCFRGPDRVVLCVWFEHMESSGGRVWQVRNVRSLRRKVEAATHLTPAARTVAVERAMRVDSAVQAAYRNHLPVRVIVNDGDRRDLDDVARTDPSHVERRLLDPSPWRVVAYDWVSGDMRLEREETLP